MAILTMVVLCGVRFEPLRFLVYKNYSKLQKNISNDNMILVLATAF